MQPNIDINSTIDQRLARLADELIKCASAEAAGAVPRAWVNRCAKHQSLRRVVFDRPTILISAAGHKDVIVDAKTYTSGRGTVLLVPAGFEVGIENAPDRASGIFIGTAIGFDQATLTQFRQLYGDSFADWDLTPRWLAPYSDKVIAAVAEWLSWTRRYPSSQAEARHRLMEILLLLAGQGMAGNLLLDHRPNLGSQLRAFLALDPARNWSATEAGKRLGISVSSLRRKLREQDTGFRSLLEEVRLGKGLELVLNTDLQIGQIAHACGDESQSRFSERFRLRFSMSPTELRATKSETAPTDHNQTRNVLPLFRRN